MQPHVNMGIRFRTYFEPISRKEDRKSIAIGLQREANELSRMIARGETTWSFVKKLMHEYHSLIHKLRG